MDDFKSLGLLDLMKFADKEVIDKIISIINAIEIEKQLDGTTKISLHIAKKE